MAYTFKGMPNTNQEKANAVLYRVFAEDICEDAFARSTFGGADIRAKYILTQMASIDRNIEIILDFCPNWYRNFIDGFGLVEYNGRSHAIIKRNQLVNSSIREDLRFPGIKLWLVDTVSIKRDYQGIYLASFHPLESDLVFLNLGKTPNIAVSNLKKDMIQTMKDRMNLDD